MEGKSIPFYSEKPLFIFFSIQHCHIHNTKINNNIHTLKLKFARPNTAAKIALTSTALTSDSFVWG